MVAIKSETIKNISTVSKVEILTYWPCFFEYLFTFKTIISVEFLNLTSISTYALPKK